MFKLLFSTALTLPVLVLAYGSAESKVVYSNKDEPVAVLSTVAEPGTSDCAPATIGVNLHKGYLETHSAERIVRALDRNNCHPTFIRITMLVDENSSAAELARAETERTEVAAFIGDVVGEEMAASLPVKSDTQTARVNTAMRSHALVSVESTAIDSPAPILASGAAIDNALHH